MSVPVFNGEVIRGIIGGPLTRQFVDRRGSSRILKRILNRCMRVDGQSRVDEENVQIFANRNEIAQNVETQSTNLARK